MLAVPPGLDAEQQLSIRYLAWLLGKLAELGAEPHVHYRPAGFDGRSFVMALEDRVFTRNMEGARMTKPSPLRSRRRLEERSPSRTADARKRQRAAEDAIALARKGGDQEAQRAFQDALAAATQEVGMATGARVPAAQPDLPVSAAASMSRRFSTTRTRSRSSSRWRGARRWRSGTVSLGPESFWRDGLVDMLQSGEFRVRRTPARRRWRPARGPWGCPARRGYGPFFGVAPQLRRRLKLLRDLIPSMPMEGCRVPVRDRRRRPRLRRRDRRGSRSSRWAT